MIHSKKAKWRKIVHHNIWAWSGNKSLESSFSNRKSLSLTGEHNKSYSRHYSIPNQRNYFWSANNFNNSNQYWSNVRRTFIFKTWS